MKKRKPQTKRSTQAGKERLATVPTSDAFEEIRQLIEALKEAVLHNRGDSTEVRESEYIEPGPNAPRKYFTPEELMKRWKWGKTKVYQIPKNELPYWKKGQLKRYFWAHVHAYEGRISWERAGKIYEQYKQERES